MRDAEPSRAAPRRAAPRPGSSALLILRAPSCVLYILEKLLVTGRVSRFVHFNGERVVRAAVNKSASRFRDFSIESAKAIYYLSTIHLKRETWLMKQ